MGLKIGLFALAALAIMSIVGAGWAHYSGIVEDNARLRENVTELKTALKLEQESNATLKEAIGEWRADREKVMGQVAEMVKATQRAGSYLKVINDKFAKHDMDKLIQAKPGLLEGVINRGTARAFRMLECRSYPGGVCPAGGGAPAADTGTP